MKTRRIRSALRICMVATLVFSAFSSSAAQPATTNTGFTSPAQAVDRNSVVTEIFNAWGDYRIPVDAENNSPNGPFDLIRALRRATIEQLLDARNAKTFDEVVAALPRSTGAGVVPRALAVGERIPLVLGDATDDLVFTPLAPCRIIDTRFMPPPTRIPAYGSLDFTVTGPNYIAQGGVATGCGIPPGPYNTLSNPKPSAVAINVTSTAQAPPGVSGFLTVFPFNTVRPLASLVNYTQGIDIANAAIVESFTGGSQGTPEITIYSEPAATHVVVDIMGYFMPPAATALDSFIVSSTDSLTTVVNFAISSGACPTGYTLTGGGFSSSVYHAISTIASSGPSGNQWLCQGTNNAAVDITCYAMCMRVPGHP